MKGPLHELEEEVLGEAIASLLEELTYRQTDV